MIDKRLVKISEAAKILGVSIDTLRRWEKTGKIASIRTPGGTRLYSIDNLKPTKARSGTKEIARGDRRGGPPSSARSEARTSDGGGVWQDPEQSQRSDFKDQGESVERPISVSNLSYRSTDLPEDKTPKPVSAISELIEKAKETQQRIKESKADIRIPERKQSNVSLDLSNPFVKGLSYSLATLFLVSSIGLGLVLSKHINILPNKSDVQKLTQANSAKGSKVLAASVPADTYLDINTNTVFRGGIIAPNLVNSVTAGSNVAVSNSTDPITGEKISTISASLPSGLVNSIQGINGDISLAAGSDISISGLTISNSSTLSTVRGRGGCNSCLTDADISDNLTISSDGSVSGSAIKGGTITSSIGGTGFSSYSTGDILYAATSGSTLSRLPIGTTNLALVVSSSNLPVWSTITSGTEVDSLNGQSSALTIVGGGINTISTTSSTITVTGTEADTLSSVTSRGSTTTTSVALNGGITNTQTLSSNGNSGLSVTPTSGLSSTGSVNGVTVTPTLSGSSGSNTYTVNAFNLAAVAGSCPSTATCANYGIFAPTSNGYNDLINVGGTSVINSSGLLNLASVTGTLGLTNGGTGASTASGARTNLLAAALGANSDITSLTGLTTPLAITEGGTGQTSTPTSAQLLIGNSSNGYTLASLTAGSNIAITSGSGAITITNTLSGGSVSSLNGLTGALTIAGGGINTIGTSSGNITVTGTEADTLSSVTSRGSTTTTSVTLNGGVTSSQTLSSGASSEVAISPTSNLSATGTINGITITPTKGGTAASNTYTITAVNLAAVGGSCPGSATCIQYGIFVPSSAGYTDILNVGGTSVINGSGLLNLSQVTGTLGVANGGTGGATAATARSALGIAASGANSDITSLTGLTTALAISEGGTGLQTTPTSGQLLIGTSGGAYTLANLTAGSGISIQNGSGAITVTNTLAGVDSLNSQTGALTVVGGGINTVSTSTNTITVTGTEADTLSSVTSRGSTTTTSVALNGGVTSAQTLGTNNSSEVAISPTSNLSATGTINGVTITPTKGGSTGSNTYTIAALNFGSVTGSCPASATCVNNSIFIPSSAGYTDILNVGGTSIINGSGQLNLASVTGTLAVGNGGTNASDATTARSNLSAAKSGANSDITSLTGLTTALAISEGGTGLTVSPSNGQLLIGTSSNIYAQNTLTAGTGISISNGAGTITINNSGAAGGVNSVNGQSGAVTIAGAGINTVSTSTNTITITGTEADTLSSVTSRGSTTATPITLSATGMLVSELLILAIGVVVDGAKVTWPEELTWNWLEVPTANSPVGVDVPIPTPPDPPGTKPRLTFEAVVI